MRVIVTDSYEDMSRTALHHLLGHMHNSPRRVNLSITAGRTPKRLYEMLVEEMRGRSCFDHVHYYNFDEIPHKKLRTPGITMTELRHAFFDPARIPDTRIHVLDESNYQGQDERLEADGGLDAMLLGIGADGHYCGNLPGTTAFHQRTARILCDARLKDRIRRFYAEEEDIPDAYVTMGPLSVMAARRLILIASGTEKAPIMKTFFESAIREDIPASILKAHPHLSVIMDRDAASLLANGGETR